MKIAFVSQPIDVVLPPFQNSVGSCTWGSARVLAKDHEVVVYGMRPERHGLDAFIRNVRFCLVGSDWGDELLRKARTRVSRAVSLQPLSTSPLNYPSYGLRLARDLSKGEFDVIHIQNCSQYAPVIREANPKAKIVLHLHAEWFSQSKRAGLLRRLEAVDLLTTVSDYVTERVRTLLPMVKTPCVTHYNGIDPAEFAREKNYTALRERDERHILFAGGISPHKGIHVLMDAFAMVAERMPNARLYLSGPAGTYPFEETFDVTDKELAAELAPFYSRDMSVLRKLVRSGEVVVPKYVEQLKARLATELVDRVTFLGNVPREELIKRYYSSDVFVFPSLFAEGFGLPPVEAMAAGTPAIGTRSGAIVETIRHGVSGLLVEKNDARALAEALLQILGNTEQRENMGRAARRRALENFSWERVTAKMSKSYEQLCTNAFSEPILQD